MLVPSVPMYSASPLANTIGVGVDPYFSVAMSRAAGGIANPYTNPYAAVAMRQSLLSEAVNPYAAVAMRQSLLSEAGYNSYANPYATGVYAVNPALATAAVAPTVAAIDGRLYASPTMYQADVFGQSFPMDAISMRMHAPFAAQHQEVQLGMGMHALFAPQHQQVAVPGMGLYAPSAAIAPTAVAAVDGRLYASPRAVSMLRAPTPAGVGPATVQIGADGRLYASPPVDARLYASPTVMTPLGPAMVGGTMF
jgi:hypothetical protein